MSFDGQIFWNALFSPVLANGALVAIALTLIAMVTAFAIGLPLALARGSRLGPVRWFALAYVWVGRAIPTLLWLLIVWNALPLFFPIFKERWFSPFLAGYIALSLNEAAYLTEVIRAGLLSVHKGQRLAARTLGMTPVQVLRYVVLPQAMRVIIPPTTNEAITLLKLTSLASVISLPELLTVTEQSIAVTFRFAEFYSAAAIYYLVIVSALMLLQRQIENRLRWTSVRSARTRLLPRWRQPGHA